MSTMETLVPLSEVEKEMESYIPIVHDFIEEVATKKAERKLHDERVRLIMSRQRKRARIREIITGILSLFGCIALPLILATIFGVPELYTAEIIMLPLGIYFLWEVL